MVVVAVPILGTIFVTASTSEPDLSELAPINERAGNYVFLDWSALLRHQFGIPGAEIGISAGSDIQALGYMVDGDQPAGKGEWVRDFVLLPEAGNLLHPAHRIPDQMIAVSLEDPKRIQFSPRALVWVWGNFRVSSERAVRSKPLYRLEQARVIPAGKGEIQRYFK
jgi:hypothetical protein